LIDERKTMTLRFVVGLAGLGTCVLLLGCGTGPADTSGNSVGPSEAAHDHAAEHNHAALGPHGGHLIVLGEEEYHAELTHDEAAHTVAVYLLDGAAKEVVTDGPEEITLQVFQEGEFADHVLKATGDDGLYAAVDEPLCHFLVDTAEVTGRVRVTIAGKEYVGILEHATHDNDDGHDHEAEAADPDHNGHDAH
jgi:hypothetical protein